MHNLTAGMLPPGEKDPITLVPVPNDLRPVQAPLGIHTTPTQLLQSYKLDPNFLPPDYLPQPDDLFIKPSTKPQNYHATGRLEYSPLSNLTGTRPVVDKYSITRYSEGEWRIHNRDLLKRSDYDREGSAVVEWNALRSIEDVMRECDANQVENTRKLKRRQAEVYRWKEEIKGAIELIMEEIGLLEVERRRIKTAMEIILIPTSIAGECLNRRTGRLDRELVRDDVEDELTTELNLTSAIRENFLTLLKEIESQFALNVSSKKNLEFEWSQKKRAHQIEVETSSLSNRSRTTLQHPGVATFQDNQSTEESWNRFVKNLLEEAENVRKNSVQLRGKLDEILMNAARDLRSQADRIELALSKRIAATEGIKQELEIELKKVMARIVDIENLIPKIKDYIRRLNVPMKTAQTRLNIRQGRPIIENVRDPPQFGLIEEIKVINESETELRTRVRLTEESHDVLLSTRSELEREILIKRKTLEIDGWVLREIRSHFPSTNALTGYID